MSPDPIVQLGLVYLAYAIAIASPGPSTMAIMGTAMQSGRKPGVVLALGVVTGSMIWACLAATGISAVLTRYAQALVVLKVAGGLYLLYLAWKSARAALGAHRPETRMAAPAALWRFYLRGVILHLGNPKAVLGWIAIMALGLRQGMSPPLLLAIIGGCGLLGLVIHPGYALVFSTRRAVSVYLRARRWIEGAMAALFAVAGVKLLLARF